MRTHAALAASLLALAAFAAAASPALAQYAPNTAKSDTPPALSTLGLKENSDRTAGASGQAVPFLPAYRPVRPNSGPDTVAVALHKDGAPSVFYTLLPGQPVVFVFKVEGAASRLQVATVCPLDSAATRASYKMDAWIDTGMPRVVALKSRRGSALYVAGAKRDAAAPRGFDVTIPEGEHTVSIQLELGGPAFVYGSFSVPASPED